MLEDVSLPDGIAKVLAFTRLMREIEGDAAKREAAHEAGEALKKLLRLYPHLAKANPLQQEA